MNQDEMCDGDIYCGATADDTDLEHHGAPVEVNICRLDQIGSTVGSRSGTGGAMYLAPSTVVVVERPAVDDLCPAPTVSNAIHLTSAPPSPTPASRNPTERQRNGGIEADHQSKKFITRFNFGLGRVRRNKKSSDHPRVGGAHNAQKRERKATKTLAIVLGQSLHKSINQSIFVYYGHARTQA